MRVADKNTVPTEYLGLIHGVYTTTPKWTKYLTRPGMATFLVNINDLPDHVKSSCKIFADDTKVYSKVESLVETTELQKDLDNLVCWSKAWLQTFKAAKCKSNAHWTRKSYG